MRSMFSQDLTCVLFLFSINKKEEIVMPLIKNLALATTFIQTVNEDNHDDGAVFFTLLDTI